MKKLLTIIMLIAVCSAALLTVGAYPAAGADHRGIFSVTAVCPVVTPTSSRPEPSPDAGEAPLPPPTELKNCALTRTDGASPSRLTDADRSTVALLDAGTTVTVAASESIGYIYIEWSDRPAAWQALCANGETVECNRSGFLHAVEEVNGSTLELSFPDGGRICDIYFFTPGDRAQLPAPAQDWLVSYGRGNGEPDDCADILLVSTHADDEHLFFGGTMPYYAGELGLQVQVAYFTNHNDSSVRPHELLDGLWTVGITHYPYIGAFPDIYSDSLEHAKTLYDYDQVLDAQVSLIRRTRPQVVLGHDLNGEYGHGVHMLNALSLTEAVVLAQEPSSPYGAPLEPWRVSKLYLHLFPDNQVTMDWSAPLSAFGGKTAFEVACDGFACHKSQQGYFVMGGSAAWNDCTKFGLYRSTVGEDVSGGDFMENVTPYAQQRRESSDTTLFSAPPEGEPEPGAAETSASARFPIMPLLLISVVLLSAGTLAAILVGRRKKTLRLCRGSVNDKEMTASA